MDFRPETETKVKTISICFIKSNIQSFFFDLKHLHLAEGVLGDEPMQHRLLLTLHINLKPNNFCQDQIYPDNLGLNIVLRVDYQELDQILLAI